MEGPTLQFTCRLPSLCPALPMHLHLLCSLPAIKETANRSTRSEAAKVVIHQAGGTQHWWALTASQAPGNCREMGKDANSLISALSV